MSKRFVVMLGSLALCLVANGVVAQVPREMEPPVRTGDVVTVNAIDISQTPQVAQDATPVLTELQKLKLQNVVQQVQISELRLQAAQRDFSSSRDAALALLKQHEVSGYTLDLATLQYTPAPSAPAAKAPETPTPK